MGFRKYYFVLLVLVLSSISFAAVETEKEPPAKSDKPVKKAVVMYGEQTLFNTLEQLDDEHIQLHYDSLKKLANPPQLIMSQIELFLTVKTLTKLEAALLLDSLFDSGDEHYALINQINLFLIDHDFSDAEEEFAYLEHNSNYPAQLIYGSWITTKPHPYSPELYKTDTTQRLKLVDRSFGDYVSPVDKIVVTSRFGHRWGKTHRGIDLDLQVWDEVKSAFSGKVRFAGYFGGYGRVVVVRHDNGLETLYAHLHRFKVKAGDDVKAGDLIALGGSSGNSSGSHLHLEVRYKGVALNPDQIIDFENKALVAQKITLIKNSWGFTAIPDGVEYYTVRRGDYLFKIAEEYGTTCNDLCKMNGIRRNTPLQVGQKIRVI